MMSGNNLFMKRQARTIDLLNELENRFGNTEKCITVNAAGDSVLDTITFPKEKIAGRTGSG